MTNKKTTKRALLMSVMALFLCVTMLMGTTYAWFTDSVTSANNKIVAGNLDVDLYMWTDATTSVEITNESDPIFGGENSLAANANTADTLWEPGKTQVVYLSIKNNGNLALKYKVNLNVSDITENMNEVLRYEITPDAKFGDGRVTGWVGEGNKVEQGINETQATSVDLLPGDEHFFALSVHMLETAGNEYMKGTITFDMIVLATQLTYEEDSFDDQYDADANFSAVASKEVTDNSVANTIDTSADMSVVIPAGAPVGSYVLEMTNKVIKTDAATNTTKVSMDIELTRDGTKVTDDGTTVYTVEMDVGAGKRVIEVIHNGVSVDMSDYSYDETTGILSISTASFSPFAVVFEETRSVSGLSGAGTETDPYLINDYYDLVWFRDHVNTCAQDGSSQYNGKFIKLTSDIDLKGVVWEPIGSTTKDHGSFYGNFDGDGHTISNLYVELSSGQGAAGFFAKVSGGGDGPRAVIKNLVFENVDVYSPDSYVGGVIGNAGSNSEIRNVTVKGDIYVNGYGYVGAVVGHGYPDMYECHVDANDGSYVICNYWCGGGLIGYAGEGGTYLEDCSVKGLYISSTYGGAGALVGLLQYSNTVRNCHAENVTIKTAFYADGYACGNGEESTYDNVSVKNVSVTNSAGVELNTVPESNTDNDALIVK